MTFHLQPCEIQCTYSQIIFSWQPVLYAVTIFILFPLECFSNKWKQLFHNITHQYSKFWILSTYTVSKKKEKAF